MENKKLLKYLLKDLSELEEMFAEKDRNSFDELEMEFIQNRVSGAKKLVQMYLEHECIVHSEIKNDSTSFQKSELKQVDISVGKTGVWVEEINQEIKPVEKSAEVEVKTQVPGAVIYESNTDVEIIKKVPEIVAEKKLNEVLLDENMQVADNGASISELVEVHIEIQEKPITDGTKQAEKLRSVAIQQELQLEDEEPVDHHNKRLSDLFSKEKSVNDIMSEDFSKLEHKLSNRPVTSLHSAIGINDKFQYVRELFEGSVDNFVKTVADLDSMNDIKDAVNYLQSNFKWKKNETSLKFINLIKRRFPNE